MGEDCAGAAQFIRAERLDEVLDDRVWNVQWLEDSDVQERLARLRQDRTSWRSTQDTGQFSLSGAQPKTALLRQDDRWGVPAGRVPTTHILKPPIPDLDGHVENEHFCLQLAMELSLPVATSTVLRFGPEIGIVVERYDRVFLSGAGAQSIKRLHQEDLCQAIGVMPSKKYQNGGGPTPAQVVELLWTQSSRPVEDVARFLDGPADAGGGGSRAKPGGERRIGARGHRAARAVHFGACGGVRGTLEAPGVVAVREVPSVGLRPTRGGPPHVACLHASPPLTEVFRP